MKNLIIVSVHNYEGTETMPPIIVNNLNPIYLKVLKSETLDEGYVISGPLAKELQLEIDKCYILQRTKHDDGYRFIKVSEL